MKCGSILKLMLRESFAVATSVFTKRVLLLEFLLFLMLKIGF